MSGFRIFFAFIKCFSIKDSIEVIFKLIRLYLLLNNFKLIWSKPFIKLKRNLVIIPFYLLLNIISVIAETIMYLFVFRSYVVENYPNSLKSSVRLSSKKAAGTSKPKLRRTRG